MESQLLERIYSGPVQASSLCLVETLPLAYELAFGAYARRVCNILAPCDFARELVYQDGMEFMAFVHANRIELLDDDTEPVKISSIAIQDYLPTPSMEGK